MSPSPLRISLVHPSRHSIAPIEEAFRVHWPQAEITSILDDALYADVDSDGNMPENMAQRLLSLFRHAELSGARGIVFTGSTFGHAVEEVRDRLSIPVLKPDEAMAEHVVEQARSVVLLCTARRALPVIKTNILSAAARRDRQVEVRPHWVEGAQECMAAGDPEGHHRLIAEAFETVPPADAYVLGQLSMVPAEAGVPAAYRNRVINGASSTVAKMRSLCGGAPEGILS